MPDVPVLRRAAQRTVRCNRSLGSLGRFGDPRPRGAARVPCYTRPNASAKGVKLSGPYPAAKIANATTPKCAARDVISSR